MLAAFRSVALFDFFFVPPRFSLTVDDVQYLVTFAVMLAVALIIGQLTARLQRQAAEAQELSSKPVHCTNWQRDLAGVAPSR